MFPNEEKIQRLKTLSRSEMRLAFYLCQGIQRDIELDELLPSTKKTRGTQKTEIYRKLGLDKSPDSEKFKLLVHEYKAPLLSLIPNEEALKTYVPTPVIHPQSTLTTAIPEEEPLPPLDKLESTQGAIPTPEEIPPDETHPTQPKINPVRSRNPLLVPFILALCLLLGVIGSAGVYLYYYGLPNPRPSDSPHATLVSLTPPLPSLTSPVTVAPTQPPDVFPTGLPTATTVVIPTATPKAYYLENEWAYVTPELLISLEQSFGNPDYFGQNTFTVMFDFQKKTNNQILLRFDASDFQATDNVNTTYTLHRVLINTTVLVGVQNVPISNSDRLEVTFEGGFPLAAKYIEVTVNLNGTKIVFRKSL